MKLKKILALVCSVAMSASLFVSTAVVADAAVEGVTASLEFAGYEVKGTATFAKVNLKVTIPDTLVPYEMVPADWETTFEDSYKGVMLQGCQFDIPNVDGLTYVASLSKAPGYAPFNANATANTLQIITANTGALNTYYAGDINNDIATIYYRITGDVNATYNLNLSSANIGLVDVDATSGLGMPRGYITSDFTIKNAVIKPASTGGSVEATQSGSTFTDAADAKAVAYVAELDSSASGKTGRWYATIGTTPMKTVKTFTLPNISAENVKLGLVYKGAETISNVAFKWE